MYRRDAAEMEEVAGGMKQVMRITRIDAAALCAGGCLLVALSLGRVALQPALHAAGVVAALLTL
jgi:hypothetical protein